MQLLDLTLPTPAENLALDEALLDAAERSDEPGECLRLWEPDAPLVVVGCSSRIATEVNEAACGARGIPILRRPSGGSAIVAAKGCLMYAVVLSYERRPELRAIDHAHRFVLGRLVAALEPLAAGIKRQGTSDLTWRGKKISGNSLRCKRGHLLYHGTILYGFPLELIEQCLRLPPKQPDYRAGRPHKDFVTNLPIDAGAARQALTAAWQADQPYDDWPQERTATLSTDKYSQSAWNQRL